LLVFLEKIEKVKEKQCKC